MEGCSNLIADPDHPRAKGNIKWYEDLLKEEGVKKNDMRRLVAAQLTAVILGECVPAAGGWVACGTNVLTVFWATGNAQSTKLCAGLKCQW